jgi:predicted transcriptional regulator
MFTYTLHIDDSLQKRLRALAEREQRPIEDVMIELLDEKITETEEDREGNLFLMLADLAEKYEPIIHRPDLSENFDEIIGDMMAEDLRRRQEEANVGT